MNYKSFLTRDYKNIIEPAGPKKRLRINRLHMLMILTTVSVVGTLFSLVSLDVNAKKHALKLNDNPDNKIVVPLDIPNEPLTTTTSTVNTEPVAQQTWQTAKVKSGDSLAVIFKRHNLNAAELHKIMQLGKEVSRLRHLQPGQQFRMQVDGDGALTTLIYEVNKFETLAIHRDGDSFIASQHHKNVEKRQNSASAKITSSLFEAGKAAGLSNRLVMELAHIFGWDVDFALDIRQGDEFTVLYEEQFLDGVKVNEGPIIAAEFVNQGKAFQAILYTDDSGRRDYYSPDGLSMRKAFLRTPVDFRRISSRFGKRKHPILNTMRMHKGVDYAAPRGTPIKASGNGKIIHKGRKGGYGHTIIIKHGGKYSTLYAHMSSYRKGMYVGKRVKQGDVIGYVGSTGRSTGPHLHYEFRVNGVHRNPLTVKLPNAKPIGKKYKAAFTQHARAILSQLDMHRETSVALNR